MLIKKTFDFYRIYLIYYLSGTLISFPIVLVSHMQLSHVYLPYPPHPPLLWSLTVIGILPLLMVSVTLVTASIFLAPPPIPFERSASFKCLLWIFPSPFISRSLSPPLGLISTGAPLPLTVSLSALLWHSVLISLSRTVDHRRRRGSDPSLCLNFQGPQTEPVLTDIKCECDIWLL